MDGTSTIPLLDPNQQAQFVSELPSRLDTPRGQQTLTRTPSADLAPNGTEDLEAQRSQNPTTTAQLLRTQQRQNVQLQGQVDEAQQQLSDPFNRIATHLADQYDQLQQHRANGIKGMVRDFFSGGGQAMMREVGLPTPEQQQGNLLQQILQVKNAQAIDTLRQAQAQNMRLMSREMPDGSVIQIPQGHVGTFDAAMARSQLANQKPDLNDLIGRTVFGAIQQGRNPNEDPIVQQLLQVQGGMQKPPADTAASQKDDFMRGIQPAIAANEITPAMLTDVRQLVSGIQSSRAIPAAQKPALVSYLMANTTPSSQGTQAQVKVNLDNTAKTLPVYDTLNKNSLVYLSPEAINAGNAAQPGRYTQAGQVAGGGKTGYAFDPKTNQTLLTTEGEATQKGYTVFRPVTEPMIRADTHDTKILNDVAIKSNNLIAAADAMNDSSQRNLIARVVDAADRDDEYRLGAFGTSIPLKWFNNLITSENASALTQKSRDYLVSLLSLREASMGMQRLLTGTARNNETQIRALQATLPGVEPDSNLALQKLGAFVQNLDMLRQGVPKLPGIDVIPINRGGLGKWNLSSHTTKVDPAGGMVTPAPAVASDWGTQFGGVRRQ